MRNPKSGWRDIAFSNLLGLTFVSAQMNDDQDEITFVTDDDHKFVLHHWQDCCEGVYVEDIVGELSDLVGSPITLAEESSNHEEPDRYTSVTWTFYKLATVKGFVDIRWCGESNGYYSEEVSLSEAK